MNTVRKSLKPAAKLAIFSLCFAAITAAHAQKQSAQQYLDVVIRADTFRGNAKRKPMVMEALGNPKLSAPDSQVTADRMSFVVAGEKGITSAKAEGNVSMRTRLRSKTASGETTDTVITGTANLLSMDRAAGITQLLGNVKIRSESSDGRVLTASAQKATIYRSRNEAVLEGGVTFTLIAPGSLEGPATFTGETFVYNLSTGEWSLRGTPQSQPNLHFKAKGSKSGE